MKFVIKKDIFIKNVYEAKSYPINKLVYMDCIFILSFYKPF